MSDAPGAWILVVGSQSSPTDGFRATCEAVGAALVHAGYGIVAGSFQDVTADAHVLRGAIGAGGGGRVRVIRPEADASETVPEEYASIAHEIAGRTWRESRPALVGASEAIVLLGGGKGTRDVYGLAEGRPVVSVPGLGGASERVYEEDRSRYLEAGVPGEWLKGVESQVPDEVGRAVVVVLGHLLAARASAREGAESAAQSAEQRVDRTQAPASGGARPGSGGATPASAEPRSGVVLLTWDPERTPWARLREMSESETAEWTASEHVQDGDRFYFLRHGEAGGLVGSGEILGDPYEGDHWDPAKQGETVHYAIVTWDTLREEPYLATDYLVEKTQEEELWHRNGSGHDVPSGLAGELDELWTRALREAEEQGTVGEQGTVEEEEPPGDEPTQSHEVETDPTQAGSAATPIGAPSVFVDTDAIASIDDRGFRAIDRDSLNAKDQAEIFASLMVASDVKPPLAIGLFGDWGVGKTFFMRLIQEKIRAISDPREREEGEDATASIAKVVQIEFNAWHYVDSDLWASLASRIFDGLARELAQASPGGELDTVRRELRQKIESSEREKREANAAIVVAGERRGELATELVERRMERQAKAKDLEKARLDRAFEAIRTDEATRNAVVGALREFGFADGLETAGDLLRARRELASLGSRGATLSRAFSSTVLGPGRWRAAAVVAVFVGLALAVGQIDVSGLAARIAQGVAQASAVVGPVLAWVHAKLGAASEAMTTLEAIEREMRAPTGTPTEHEKSLESEIAAIDIGLAMHRERISEAERQIAAAEGEIHRIESGGLVYDFLEGRVRDSRYIDRLGLISVIRQDLERLGSLLAELESIDSSVAPQRIILYIDDLDRCEPERVVEVLQAVHLLLAFDLFVVVVAVDARWLERSLNERYNPARPDPNAERRQGHRFDAHNYLEKIFQIPFSLPAMDEGGFRQLVTAITASPRLQAEADRRREEAREAGSGEAAPGVTAVTPGTTGGDPSDPDPAHGDAPTADPPAAGSREERSADAGRPSDQEEEHPVDPPATERADPDHDEASRVRAEEERRAQERAEEERKARERGDAERRAVERARAEQRIATMMLAPCEERYMAALHAFLETPRLTKRFVNVYRLLRVRIAADGDFAAFTEASTGAYRAVLTLLAITVGRPDVAPDLLQALQRAPDDGPLLEWLEQGLDEASPTVREGVVRIRRDLDRVVAALQAEDHGQRLTFDPAVEAYRTWASEVGRYSFRWHLRDGARDGDRRRTPEDARSGTGAPASP